MDPITMALLGAGLNVGAGILGELLGADDRSQEYENRKQALAQIMGVSVPELETLVAKEQGPTNLANVNTDPALEGYQEQAQARLAEIGNSGGRDARAQARFEQARMDAARTSKNSQEAILSEARARGSLGTGQEVSALLQGDQAAADRERMAGVQALGDDEDRALQAIMEGGSMASSRQSAQWGRRAQVASAQDAIDNFNTSTANNFTLQNANQRNIHFQQEMQAAGAKAGALDNMADYYGNRADRTSKMVGGIGQAAGYAAGAVSQSNLVGGGTPAAPAATTRQATSYETQNPGAIGANAAYQPGMASRRKVR